jgi:hypothetical protein
MKWWIYRLAIALKEAGQRWRFPAIIMLGLKIREFTLE